jgi:4-hydroxy-3-methylbut-2-enyl diphosphate reductase
MNSDEFLKIGEKLKKKFSNLKIFNTLCISPVKTQDEAVRLAGIVDLMIIVGDKMSANNNTLFEKVKNVITAMFIETADELDIYEIGKYEKIGISGGSSTPDWQIEKIKSHLENGLKE